MATIHPILRDEFQAAVDLSGAQLTFVEINAAGQITTPSAGALAFPLDDTPTEGEYGTVYLVGEAKVIAGGTISAGQTITTNASGQAVVAASTNAINGIALEPAVEGQVFRFLIATGATHA